jgi:hypothetical protein
VSGYLTSFLLFGGHKEKGWQLSTASTCIASASRRVASQRRPGVLFWLNVLMTAVWYPTRTVQYFSRRYHSLSWSAHSPLFMKPVGQFIVRFGVLRRSLVTIAVLWNASACSSVLRSEVTKKQQPVVLVLPFQPTRRHVSKESNKKGNVHLNVSFTCVRVTVFATQNNKYYIFYVVCVSAALGIQDACPVVPYFSTLPLKHHDFRKELLNTKCAFWFSLHLLSETFLILRRTQRDMIRNVHKSSCKLPDILVIF